MKRLTLASLIALAACQSFTDVEQKRPYSCNWRDAGVDECPTGWRCGYDNRCFNPTVPVGLKTCKLTQDCFDGFRCSAENACFNPGIEAPRSCRESADCAPNWRCGITSVCQNRDAGATSLGRRGQQQSHIALPDQAGSGTRGDADHRNAKAAGMGDDIGQFRRFTRI